MASHINTHVQRTACVFTRVGDYLSTTKHSPKSVYLLADNESMNARHFTRKPFHTQTYEFKYSSNNNINTNFEIDKNYV